MRKLIHSLKITFLFISIFFLAFLQAGAQVFGVKTIPGDYASITQAVQQIRTVGVSGPTYLELQPGYNSASETFPIKIREIPGASSVNSVTISPAPGVTGLSIISAGNGSVIEFIGAYSVIIDGRPGRTGIAKELTIRSTSTTGRSISFLDGAVDNTVTYCNVEGAAGHTFPIVDDDKSVVYFGRSTEPIPDGILLENTNNTLSNCVVSGTQSPQSIICAAGSLSVLNAANKIIDNELFNFYYSAIKIFQHGGTNWTITGNSIYNLDANAAAKQVPISFLPGAGSVNNIISGNYIGGQASRAGGDQWVIDETYVSMSAILIFAGSVVVENNIIQNIKLRDRSRNTVFYGIQLEEGVAQIRGNLIGGTTSTNGIVLDGIFAAFFGIYSLSCSPVSIENNTLSNIEMMYAFNSYFRGIQFRVGSSPVVTGNQVDQISQSGLIVDFSAISTIPPDYPHLAECPASPQPSVIDYNLVKSITLSSDGDSASFSGIEISGTDGPASQLHNNQVYKINVSAPEGIASFTGININDRVSGNTGNIIGSATEANSIMVTGKNANATAILVNQSPDASISDDIIGNIYVNGIQSASLDGIRFMGGGVSKVSGNQLNDLAVSSSGSSTMVGISFYGAVTGSEASTLHNNKVYKVNVSSTDGTASFSGITINDRIAANTGNIIGSPIDANSIVVTGKSAFASGIRLKNSPDVSVSDDIIANIVATGTLTPASVNGILFEAGALAKVSGNNIHHLSAPLSRGIFLQPSNGASSVTVEKNTLTGTTTSAGTGMETFVASEASLNLIATDNTVSNWQTGILLAAASGATLQQSFQSNAVIANQTGFINQNGAPVNATCNWWGDASGPSGAGPGTGNPVGPNVIFSPWATLVNYVAVNAGPDQTITGSGSKTLSPTFTICGTPNYLWSTGATTPSITVSPTVTTVYSIKITDANGHEATDEVTVFVENISLPKISIISTAVVEGNNGTNNAVFILVLNKLSAVPVTVQYQTSNITATTPQDYTQKSGTVTFPANSLIGLVQTITIQVKGDVLPETDETFKVQLSNAVNATINNASGTCTIIDNDPPCVRINDATATENSQQAVITVSLSAASSKTVKVKYDTKDGTAKAPGDYTKVSSEAIIFQPGETTKNINIVVKKDGQYNEPTEKFQVILKDPENASIVSNSNCTAKKEATVSIVNSANQQNRGVLTTTPLPDKEETPGIIVPGLLTRYSQLNIRGLKGMDNSLLIVDSRGIVVAKFPHYKNTWSPGNLAPGIYFYHLSVRNREGKSEMYRGKILITD